MDCQNYTAAFRSKPNLLVVLISRNPHAYLKKDVIGAIMDCLIAQCREAESAKCNESTTEKVILEEFGRCLNDVIKASAQQTKPY